MVCIGKMSIVVPLEALTVSFDDPHTDSLVTGACYVTLSSIFA